MASLLQHSDWLNGRVPDAVRVQLRQLVEVVGYLPYRQPLGVITADAVLLAANRPFLDLLGVKGDEQLGADWDDFMPGWSERVSPRGSGTPSRPRTRAFEEYVLPIGGDPVWVKVVASPVSTPGEGGETDPALAAWTVFVVDRSSRKSDPDEGGRRAILELLLESPCQFVVQLDADGRLEYISPSLRRALGLFGDGLEGRPLAAAHELVPASFAESFPRLMEELAGPPYRAELEMAMTAAGEERIVQWRFESLLADGGALRGVLGVGRDVTGHRRAERERAQSELRLRTLVETTNQLIWTTGPGGAIDAPMDTWSAFTGQSSDETIGDGWLEAVHPDDRERVHQTWTEAVAARRPYSCEYRLRTAAGRYCWIEAHAVLLESEGDQPYYFGVGQDVTERRRAVEDRVLGLAVLEQAMERTVTTLSGAMSTRDPYTTGHERRVSELAVAIGSSLGMTPEDLRLLRLAGTVHDIGKISVPAEILSKPTRLSPAEFAIIQGHSEAGWKLLEPAGLPSSIMDAVLQHHERMDGSGYPGGLSGDEIGEFARILAVADVVEAMSSDRPYRPAIGVGPALQEIEEGRVARYDERVADGCLRLFRDGGFTFSG